ncbi:MAG: alternative oxidase [Rhodosalinus sp.]
MRLSADRCLAKRHGHRAVVQETIAAVAGMVRSLLQHLRRLSALRISRGAFPGRP